MFLESSVDRFAVGFAVFVAVAKFIFVHSRRYQHKQVFVFWQQVGLPMGTDQIQESLRIRLRRSNKAAFYGGLTGGLFAAWQLTLTPNASLSFSFVMLTAFPAVLIGATLFDVAAMIKDAVSVPRRDVPRLARAQAVSITDYISAWRFWSGPVITLLAVVLGVGGLVMGTVGVIDLGTLLQGAALPFLFIAVMVQVACWTVLRKIMRKPQTVSSSLELAWDDAVRAHTVLKVGMLATIMAWLAFSAMGLAVLEGAGVATPESTALVIAQTTPMLGCSGIFMVFSYGSSFNYFRRHLWPDIGASKVVLGQGA